MPIYQYQCDECARTVDEFRAVSARHDAPICHGRPMSIVICAPAVQADLPGYVSPTTGRWIEGRAARREDLKRSHSRPWEGFDQERKAARQRDREAEIRLDRQLEHAARTAFHELPPAKRRLLEGDA